MFTTSFVRASNYTKNLSIRLINSNTFNQTAILNNRNSYEFFKSNLETCKYLKNKRNKIICDLNDNNKSDHYNVKIYKKEILDKDIKKVEEILKKNIAEYYYL